MHDDDGDTDDDTVPNADDNERESDERRGEEERHENEDTGEIPDSQAGGDRPVIDLGDQPDVGEPPWIGDSDFFAEGEDEARFRVLDADSKPTGGVPLTVEFSKEDGTTETVQTTAGPTGYATVDLPSGVLSNSESVTVTPATGGRPTTVSPEKVAGGGASTVELPNSQPELDVPDQLVDGLDSQVITTPPNIEDVRSAPELFNPTVIEENGTCSLDFTAKVDVTENYFTQLVREAPESPTGDDEPEGGGGYWTEQPDYYYPPSMRDDGRSALDGPVPFDLTNDYPNENVDRPTEEDLYLQHASQPTLGTLNLYKQSWTRVGHGVGKLLHSLTLAPCESTEVAIIEWSRTERGRRSEQSSAREQKSHELHRDRMIQEIVEGLVKEDQWGSSSSMQGGFGISGGLAGKFKKAVGSLGLSIGGGAARSRSESHGRRELQASTVQNLRDSVVQGASNMRSLRSTVVTQSQEVERDEVRTRAVENHNRNHALSVQYFQVLEHYNVQTELDRETRVLMVPYEMPVELWDEMPDFDEFVVTDFEARRMLSAVPERAAEILGEELDDAPDEPAPIEPEVERAIDDVLEDDMSLLGMEDTDTEVARDAYQAYRSGELTEAVVDPMERGRNGPYSNIPKGKFHRAVRQAYNEEVDTMDPRDRSDLIAWLDANAEQLRDLVPPEHEGAFDALYRLVHTPEVYKTSQPTVTASSWTVELREAWKPAVTIMIHTTDNQTVTLDHDGGSDATAVAQFSSPPIDVRKIESVEVNFAPQKAVRTVLQTFGNSLEDISDPVEDVVEGAEDVVNDVAELFGAEDDGPFIDEVKQSKRFELNRLRVTAHTDPMEALPRSRSYELLDKHWDLDDKNPPTLTYSNPARQYSGIDVPEPDIHETATRRYDDYSEIESLVDHITANRMSYLRQLWLNEDPDRRALRFQQYTFDVDEDDETRSVPVLDLIENRAVGVVGNSVAFPLLDQDRFDDGTSPDAITTDKVVSLPSRGVYAETLLSHCNATEIRDLDRAVTDRMGCTTEAPEIQGVSPGSRHSDVGTEPMGPPQSSVTIQNAPGAPAPTGLQGALKTLSQPDIFRDMSLGSETVNAANNLAQTAMQQSGEARKQTLEALSSILDAAEKSGGDGEGGGGSGDGSRNGSGGGASDALQAANGAIKESIENAGTQAHRASDPVKNRDHVRNLEKANEEGKLTDEQTQRGTARTLNADESSGGGGRDVDPVQEMNIRTTENWVKGKMLLADFDIGEHHLNPEHEAFLRNQLRPNLGEDGRIVLLEGHASKTGEIEDNQALSERRAKSVRDFLVETLGLPAHRIGTVKGVGETDQINANGPIEDPAERSVILKYEAHTPEPIIEPPQTDIEDPPGNKHTKWEIRFEFDRTDDLSTIVGAISDPMSIPLDMLKRQSIGVSIRNREESDPRTLKGQILYRGLQLGLWLKAPPSDALTGWVEFETREPMSEMAWHGVTGNLQIAIGSAGSFESGVRVVTFDSEVLDDVVEVQARLTSDDTAIGVQTGSSFMGPGGPFLEAQLWLTDPKPKKKRTPEGEVYHIW